MFSIRVKMNAAWCASALAPVPYTHLFIYSIDVLMNFKKKTFPNPRGGGGFTLSVIKAFTLPAGGGRLGWHNIVIFNQ